MSRRRRCRHDESTSAPTAIYRGSDGVWRVEEETEDGYFRAATALTMTHRGHRSLRMMIDSDDPQYSGLKKLKLQGRDLSDLSNELFSLHELQVLDASPEREACLYFKLAEIPAAIGRLVNLRILLLDTNGLHSLPAEIGNLVALERLVLSNNDLKEVPAEFANLKSLKSLHLANNHIHRFPEEICNLEELEFLDMSDNQLLSLSPSISHLKKLESLMLYENQLEVLPIEICELVELQCLWLGNNKLSSLPPNFGRLKQLNWAWHYTSTALDGNPLVSPPLEVCQQGIEEIEKYFEQDRRSSKKSIG